jgi:hypothetical protein
MQDIIVPLSLDCSATFKTQLVDWYCMERIRMEEQTFSLETVAVPQKHSVHLLQPEEQFDFWLGEWDLTWAEGGKGTNTIERILDGKVIQESFDSAPSAQFKGMSFSVYNPALAKWQQTWVDNAGNYLDFIGGYVDGSMILAREVAQADKTVVQRMVFYNIAETSLDWNWERSLDQGATWEILWQIHYQRKS